ncbi:hypothetical protein [Flavobacterium sp. FlaQc-30]|uniref:hypothetical protein n=1 Tax=Flavobacterium sp. FlaQc-30 TaxID=3374179 RepID=UPI0037578A71
MMQIKNLNRNKSIVQQVNAIRTKYSTWKVSFNSFELKAVGILQPTSRSEAYTIEVKFHILKPIQVRVISPILIKNEKGENIPHMYSQENLCLYMPKYDEFTRKMYISDTIIPWISLWLYYYEIWHTTNEWLGGGEHP